MTQQPVQVIGADTLARTLDAAADDVRDLDLMDAARLVQGRARGNAPKRTGVLASSVYAEDLGEGDVAVASDLVYAPVIHYGWAAHNITPQPFLTDALANSTPLVVAQAQAQVRKALASVRGAP